MKIAVKKLLIILAAATAIAIGIAFARGIVQAEGKDVLRCLSDAFFVSGALVLLSGGLVWCADNGVADHDYRNSTPTFREVCPGHFVLCDDAEFEKYSRIVSEQA